MAVSTQVIRFTKETSGTTNVTQDVSLNFTPKAIIIFSDCNTADNTASAHHQWSHGFSDGTTHACVTITSDDADAAADTQTVHSGSVYVRMNETNNGTVLERATCAFISNGVRFTWAVASTDGTRICMWAIGGDDITNVKVNTVDVGRNTTGTQDYTGLGFTPVDGNSVLFTLSSFSAALSDSSVTGASSHFGCAVSASKEWSIANVMEDTRDPSDTWNATYDNHCLVNLNETTGAVEYLAEFSAWISDGFRLNYTDAPSATTDDFSYLVIKGGTWDAGIFQSATTPTNNVDTTVSVSSLPIKGLLTATTSQSTLNTPLTYAMGCIGATDGTNQAAIAFIDEDAQATMDSYRINTAASVVRIITINGAAQHTASIDSFGTNSFRLDWSATPYAVSIGYVVVADQSTSQNYPVTINETSVSVSESLIRVQTILKPISETAVTVSELLDPTFYLTKNISEPSISISETLVRAQTHIKSISDPSISVSEQLVKGLAYTKAINESTINTNDTIVRIPTYLKPISETAITTNDSIARWISVSYTLTEPSISVNDTIAGALFYLRTISDTPAITTNDSIVRLLSAVRTIADPSITVSDTITRIQTILRQISETEITVNDSLQAGLLLTISLVESRIKWYYSLLTRKVAA